MHLNMSWHVAASFHVEIPYFVYFYVCYLSLRLPRKCEALLCYNYTNSNSHTSSMWFGFLSHCPWNPWSNPWRVYPVERIHIWLMSIAREWHSTHSKSLVLHYPHGVSTHGGIIKIHPGPDGYSVHFWRIPFSFHPWCISQGKNTSTHHMANRISHSTTVYILSDALSQYDMLEFFSDKHYNS